MATAKEHPVYKVLSDSYTETCKNVITRENLDLTGIGFPGKTAYVLHGVLSPEECDNLIKETESVGYRPALIHHGDVAVLAAGYRDSQRVMIDDKEFSSILFQRIFNHLPQRFQHSPKSTIYRLKEINERLRFLRYDIGDKFKAHYDSYYERADGSAQTWITLQLYLNDEGVIGGETTFLRVGSDSDYLQAANRVPVKPVTGSVLVFQNDILHEGSKVYGGRKYTIRMDVLYEFDDDANQDLD